MGASSLKSLRTGHVMPLKAGKGDTWSYLRVCFPGLPKDLMGVLEDDNQSPGPFHSEIQ